MATIEVSNPSMLVQKPVVSVLMLAYNHGKYIAQSIESVLAQNFDFPVELLIGEDCSSDSSREIALSYQRRNPEVIRVITADCNVGLYRNYRRLLLAARGRYFAHLDGDDYWLPDKLKLQIEFMHENSGCMAVYTNAITVNEAGERVGFFNDVDTQRFDIASLVRRGNFLNTSSMVFRAELRELLLEIDSVFIDYRIHLRLARAGTITQLGKALTAYRINSSSSMLASANEMVRMCYWQALLDAPRNLITDDDFAHGLADFLRRIIFRTIRTRRLDLLQQWLPRVISVSPTGRITMAWMTLESILRQACLAIRGWFVKGEDGRRIPVLHRR
jgi:glycosyltransferase involved in cell wall biosynthesis